MHVGKLSRSWNLNHPADPLPSIYSDFCYSWLCHFHTNSSINGGRHFLPFKMFLFQKNVCSLLKKNAKSASIWYLQVRSTLHVYNYWKYTNMYMLRCSQLQLYLQKGLFCDPLAFTPLEPSLVIWTNFSEQ